MSTVLFLVLEEDSMYAWLAKANPGLSKSFSRMLLPPDPEKLMEETFIISTNMERAEKFHIFLIQHQITKIAKQCLPKLPVR